MEIIFASIPFVYVHVRPPLIDSAFHSDARTFLFGGWSVRSTSFLNIPGSDPFGRNSSAPADSAAALSSLCIDTTMIRVPGSSRFISLVASRPPITGISMSMKIRSGWRWPAVRFLPHRPHRCGPNGPFCDGRMPAKLPIPSLRPGGRLLSVR